MYGKAFVEYLECYKINPWGYPVRKLWIVAPLTDEVTSIIIIQISQITIRNWSLLACSYFHCGFLPSFGTHSFNNYTTQINRYFQELWNIIVFIFIELFWFIDISFRNESLLILSRKYLKLIDIFCTFNFAYNQNYLNCVLLEFLNKV